VWAAKGFNWAKAVAFVEKFKEDVEEDEEGWGWKTFDQIVHHCHF
jgi:hypothetical protein